MISGTHFQLFLGPKIQEEPKRGPFCLPECKELCKFEESYKSVRYLLWEKKVPYAFVRPVQLEM
jgi:hypothetical protein